MRNVQMSLQSKLDDLDRFENDLIETLSKHPVFVSIREFSDDVFREIVAQRRALSFIFVPVYMNARAVLRNTESQTAVWRLVEQEFNPQPHSLLLFEDLKALGIPYEQAVSTAWTPQTILAMEESQGLLHKYVSDEEYQVQVLATIRTWGEVLVSVEYEGLWPQMQDMGLRESDNQGGIRSVFYWPHVAHDKKISKLTERVGRNDNHSEQIARHLLHYLKTPELIDFCAAHMKRCADVRIKFYDQFLERLN